MKIPSPEPPSGRALDVAFFVRALSGGGAQRDAILLANAVAAAGRSVAVVTLQATGHLRDIVAPGVAVIETAARQLRSAAPDLARAVRDLAPRILVSAEAAPNTVAVVATRLLPGARRPKLVLREASSPSFALRLDPYLQNRLAYRAIRWTYPRADLVLTLTEGARDDLVRGFGVPSRLVAVLRSNAVVEPGILDADVPEADETPRDTGLVVSLGRLSPEKDFPTLIRAAALVPSDVAFRLEIAGDGPARPELAALIGELGVAARVRLIGHVPDPFGLLRRASLAVCSSRYEGFGNAIVEALACGTPVVSTDCPFGPAEILDHGRLGTLVPVADPAALADAITTALARPTDRRTLRDRARLHTLPQAAAAFLRLVDGL